VFKVVFPELYKLKNGTSERDVQSVRKKIADIVETWQPQGQLKELTDRIDSYLGIPMYGSDETLIQFYEDIMPVVMRIRKLTPTETGRLMGLRDDEIQKMYDAGLSNSAMYKLHGNSIVINVMTALFDKMFVNTEEEKTVGMQLSLF
jgi:site-specific DNA-cytosine methylase